MVKKRTAREEREANMGALHTHDNWHWERMQDGSVHITDRSAQGNANAVHDLDASQWSSVVSHLSAAGETAATRERALCVHAGGPDPGQKAVEEILQQTQAAHDEHCAKLEAQLAESESDCAALQIDLNAAKAAQAHAEREATQLREERDQALVAADNATAGAIGRLGERMGKVEANLAQLCDEVREAMTVEAA